MEASQVVLVLGALAQETRLSAFRLLVRAGPAGLPAGQLAERLDVPAPTLSFHLRELSHAGLVRAEREGRSLRYLPVFPRLDAVLAYLTEHCCEGSGRRRRALDRIR
jgi:DNA-binding transcriptional ArsR family regulator